MLLNLKSLFNSEINLLPVALESEFSTLDRKVNFSAKGKFEVTSHVVVLNLSVSYKVDSFCSRCLKPVEREGNLTLSRRVVSEIQEEESSDYLLVENFEIDIKRYVEEELILSFSITELCEDSCKGLCPDCGADLNAEPCDCIKQKVDPRLEVLKQLLDKGNN